MRLARIPTTSAVLTITTAKDPYRPVEGNDIRRPIVSVCCTTPISQGPHISQAGVPGGPNDWDDSDQHTDEDHHRKIEWDAVEIQFR